ncbi:MAG: COX15/CtaA family protein [Acidimicrobiaceae bacterium]|nr:COX15/CtaA family protein [Acidimicrobiaceae bacterium]
MRAADAGNLATARRAVVAGGRVAWRTIRHRELPPATFRLATGLAVWALAFIIVSGAAVRLTGSGLGCADWPGCTTTQVVAPWQFHAWVEFGNRLITGLVSIAVGLAVLAALIRAPRRRDLTWLSLGLVAGLIAEIVLGGLTVEHKLAPGYVTAHFLLALVFLADAVILHHRAALADDSPPGRAGRARPAGRPVAMVSREHLILSRLLLVACSVVCLLGTVVTSTGPHGGAPQAPRFAFSLHDVAQLHGTSVEVFLFFTIVTLWSMSRAGVPASVLRRGELLLVVLVAQGGIGYLQYFTGVPAALVALHIVGVVSVVWATLVFNLGLYTRVPDTEEPTGPPVPAFTPELVP